jgi:N-acetylneuraminate synthase
MASRDAGVVSEIRRVAIGNRDVAPDAAPFVIAEVSANHLGSKQRAIEIIRASADAGADAVKLQHYTADTITVRSDHPDFKVGGGTLWDGRTLADLYDEATTPWEWTADLVAAATDAGVQWLSSPFSKEAVDFLDDLDVPAFKIASFELVDLPLIRHAAAKGRPMIMSTGMATVEEIDAALDAATSSGAPDVALLRCNSAYPAPLEAMDLRAIPAMRERWAVEIGLSDHTLGSTSAVTAVALGATIVEKHVTLRRSDGGPDAAFSAEPDELAELVTAVRNAHASLGTARFGPSPEESGSLVFRRSVRAVRPIEAGATIGAEDVASIRPAGGLAPDDIDLAVGAVARVDLPRGAPITFDVIELRAERERG